MATRTRSDETATRCVGPNPAGVVTVVYTSRKTKWPRFCATLYSDASDYE